MSDNTPNGIVKSTQRIAVISGKGGTGKSLVTASIGFVLAHCGYKVLLVDMDLFTGGLTFFLSGISDKPDRISRGLLDSFADGNQGSKHANHDNCKIDKIKISHEFVDDNLFLLPSLSSRRRNVSELAVSKDVSSLPQIIDIIYKDVLYNKESFDYIIFDTRGGSDITSVGSAMTCDKLVVVTEADKVSWDTGRILLEAIEDGWNAYCYDNPFPGVGFILNKNVLPSEGVETYLKKIWSAKHITTIPLDKDAIAYFQEDKIPVVEDVSCEFSEAIVTGIKDFFSVMAGEPKILERYNMLRMMALERKRERDRIKRSKLRMRKMSVILTMYSIVGVLVLSIFDLTDSIPWKYVLWALLFVSLLSVSSGGILHELNQKIISIKLKSNNYDENS